MCKKLDQEPNEEPKQEPVQQSEQELKHEPVQAFGGAFIAFGSNLGDRLENIERACHELDATPGIRIIRTSALYETDPMYVEDQDRFLNGVCQVRHI